MIKSQMFGHKGAVTSICLGQREKILFSASNDATIRVWDIETNQQINVLKAHTDIIFSLSYSSKLNILCSLSDDQSLW